jgi:hypothetical protein
LSNEKLTNTLEKYKIVSLKYYDSAWVKAQVLATIFLKQKNLTELNLTT